MKALLLKDFYQTKKYCRSYLLIVAVFTAVTIVSPEFFFFSAYVCMITGMLPVTLMAYDERSKWNNFTGALPYGKAEIVLSKYLIGLLMQIAVVIASLLIKIAAKGFNGILNDILVYIYSISVTLVMVGIVMPFLFWLGVEKGRIAYFALVGTMFGLIFLTTNTTDGNDASLAIFENASPLTACAVLIGALILYSVSGLISTAIYKKHEINS